MRCDEREIIMVRSILLDVCRPCLKRLPVGAGTVYRMLGGYKDSVTWWNCGFRISHGIDHGYRMILDLGDVFQRETYYLGKFYEWSIQAIMGRVLRSGDSFIDVGANIGMLTLLGAKIVQERGCVLAFEPNPEAYAHLNMHVIINRLGHVKAFSNALSSERQTLTLTIPGDRSSVGTLRQVAIGQKRFEVQTALLDEYVKYLPGAGRVLLKTDAEGYDFRILMGARELLSRPEVLVISEVNHKWLGELGESAEEMFAFMNDLGYRPYYPYLYWTHFHRRLGVKPLTLPGPHHWFNVLFMRQQDYSMFFDESV